MHRVEDRRLAVVAAIGDVLEEEFNLLARDDVADVVATAEAAERESDHLVVVDGGAAAVARVDRGVDLDPQAGRGEIVEREVDSGYDALRDRERGASGGEAVNHHRVLHRRQLGGARQRRAAFEKRFVVELEDREIDALRDRFDGGGKFVAGLVRLHLHLARVEDHVRVGQDAFAFEDDARAGRFARPLFRPGLVRIRKTRGGENLHHRIFHRTRLSGSRRCEERKRGGSQNEQEAEAKREQHGALRQRGRCA